MIRIMILQPAENGARYELTSPTAMPQAGAFLWNQKMMIQVTCRGYATAQFMQPEPAKYSHAPNLEARTFMQPEQNYYAHHPGRFVYVKDEDTGAVFSAPYEPVRAAPLDRFVFSAGQSDVAWTVEQGGLRVELLLGLPVRDVAELWTVKVTNLSGRFRRISVYPYFTVGYMSWMNQSAEFRADLGALVASSVTPYQKVEDYFKNKYLKDKTYLLCETAPDAWEANQRAFEGEGGLHAPSAVVDAPYLGRGDARYETPAAVVQYRLALDAGADGGAGGQREYRFLFGPAFDDAEIRSMRDKYLSRDGFAASRADYARYMAEGAAGCLRIETPDGELDNFVNHWLPRQVYYHGDVNRLTTDPQTRNYLQDNMGMNFIRPAAARQSFLTALSQQRDDGAMPDGILLVDGAELKYINQVPHTDHCVWLPVALDVYLAETADYALLEERVRSRHQHQHYRSSSSRDDNERKNQGTATTGDTDDTVFARISRAMDWLLAARDERGLSYIAQGDWCDPMNMVGYKGRGVSGWLTLATAYALRLWAAVCAHQGRADLAERYLAGASHANAAANEHLWDGDWFARGITDDGVVFGTRRDREGRIWLNPQAWAMLSGADEDVEDNDSKETTRGGARWQRRARMLAQVDQQLGTPYGVAMFAPPYSSMREDVGRVTQKHPGSAENGAVYNHAAAFYVYSLYAPCGGDSDADRAFRALRQMVPGPSEEDYLQRGQMPIYIPNYYRGAWREFPRTAGRSSQLFNTGTVSWVYRCVSEGLCGLRGDADGLCVRPNLPSWWDGAQVRRRFRGATFAIDIRRSADAHEVTVLQGGQPLPAGRVTGIREGETYELTVLVPKKQG